MGWRTLIVQNPCVLSLRQGQLQISRENESFEVPLLQIGMLLIESEQIQLLFSDNLLII